MAAQRHRWQVLFFLVAIILPCVVLVVLGLRMVAQERELAEKRLADERRRLTGQLRQELGARLDRMALREATTLRSDPGRAALRAYQDPAVALVATVSEGHLVLPWERDPRATRFRRSLDQDRFARLVARGEHAEIGSRDPGGAIGAYTEALAATSDPAQATWARLLRGRAALAAGRRHDALRDYTAVLGSGLDIIDEHGVPLALYAATRLLEAGGRREAVADAVRRTAGGPRWLSPTALYLLRDLGGRLAGATDAAAAQGVRDLAHAMDARLARSEQAIALQGDFPQLRLNVGGGPSPGAESRWITYGAPAWLVGRAAALGGEGEIVVAVWADSILPAVADAVLPPSGVSGKLAIASGDGTDGERLGDAFPGLVVRFGSPAGASEPVWGVRRWFYLVTLVLVVSVALFGAYLVSRDVRRELRLAELRSQFVSTVSHELKTPLTAIRMFAETLQLGRSPDPETQTEYLETIVNESERLTRLLNNVLDFSKIERGRKQYRRAPTDLAEIVGASARAMRYPLEQQRFTLTVAVQDGLPPADVDGDAIEQAILNLLSNAMKYSGDSRVIDLRLTGADGEAVIEVADRGVGIGPDEQRRIFDQFYRVPTQDDEGIPGTGLGLTLVRHIAEGHGGRVTVASVPGQGSTFAIHLPLGNGAV